MDMHLAMARTTRDRWCGIERESARRGGRAWALLAALTLSGVLGGILSGCARRPIEPQMVASFAGYTEGIVFDRAGDGYVSVLNHKSVWRVKEGEAPAVWYGAAEPNGHKVLADGTHLIAARGGVHHVDAMGKLIAVLAPELTTPNDLALDGDGGVYVTVPAESAEVREARGSGVYYVNAQREVRQVAGDLCYPNGIVVRADGKSLLVDDSCDGRIYEFVIEAPGVVTQRRMWAQVHVKEGEGRSVPDGMTQDRDGRVYMADYGRGVVVFFDAGGEFVREYATGLKHASNVAFGGEDLSDLYVTGSVGDQKDSGRLMVLPLNTRGRRFGELPRSIGRD